MCENCRKTNVLKEDKTTEQLNRAFEEKEKQLIKKVAEYAIQKGSISVDKIQKLLMVGYSRAALILDKMEAKGYIEPSTGASKRKVLITPEQFRKDFGEN